MITMLVCRKHGERPRAEFIIRRVNGLLTARHRGTPDQPCRMRMRLGVKTLAKV